MAWRPQYATAAQLRAYAQRGDLADTPELDRHLEAASRGVDHATNRQFGKVEAAETRTYELRWSRTRGLFITKRMDDIHDLTDLVVTVSGSAVSSANYELRPINNAQDGRPYTDLAISGGTSTALGAGARRVDITAWFGWNAYPATIVEATMLQALRLATRPDAPFGVAGSPDVGSEVRLLERLDPDVAAMVRSFRRDEPRIG